MFGIKINDAEIVVLESSCMMLGFVAPILRWALVEKDTHTFLYGHFLTKWVGKGDALNGNHATTTKEDYAATPC
jgi:hypothetical protein